MNPSVFTSNPIPNNAGYSFVITDSNNCEEIIVENSVVACDCLSQDGSIEDTSISVCENEVATVIHLGGENLDANDVLSFGLFDQMNGSVLQLQSSTEFAFDAATMSTDQSYFLAALVGNDDGNGLVDLNDDCLSISNFVEVVFNHLPSVANVFVPQSICDGATIDVIIEFSGTLPFSFTFEGQPMMSDSNSFHTTAMVGNQNPTLDMEDLTDGNHCIAANGLSVSLFINDPPNLSLSAAQNSICVGESVQLLANSDPNVTYQWQPNTTLSCSDCANPITSPVTTTTYEVTVIGSNNCSSTSSVTIDVAQPNIDFMTNDTTICSGQTVNLEVMVPNAVSYAWSPANGLSCIDCPNPTATITENITCEVLVTGSDGCILTESVEIVQTCWLVFDEIKVGDLGYRELHYPPYKLAAFSDACNDIEPNAAINFTGGGATPDSLLFVGENPGKDTICLQFVHPQNALDVEILTIILQVRGNDIFNLEGNAGTITAEGVTLSNSEKEKTFLDKTRPAIYPNPTTNELTVNSAIPIRRICLFDFSGQLVLEKLTEEKSNQLNVGGLAAGVYLLKIETEEKIWTERVVKME